MAVEGINAFKNFSTTVNFHQSANQRTNTTANTGQGGHKPLPPKKNKNYTTPIVVGAVALAALGTGIYAHKTGKLGEVFSSKAQKLNKKINDVIHKSMSKANEVIAENTAPNGMVNLPAIDAAAGLRSIDITKAERLHQAATWLEEAYKNAYSRAQLSDGKNMFNYIHEYIKSGRTALPEIYTKMPAEEANIRIQKFADDIKKMDSHNGMTSESFIKDFKEVFMKK